MKPYKEDPKADIAMHHDSVLIEALAAALRTYRIDTAFETGTYIGNGSTRLIAECMKEAGIPKAFTTIEIDFGNWLQARANLSDCLFVNCLWGSATGIEAAIEFMQNDEMLLNHQNYPNIYIDEIDNPLESYITQLNGLFNYSGFKPGKLTAAGSRDWLWSGEDLLSRLIETYGNARPLIVLDSAGGIGFLEFKIMLEQMGGREYLLLLDDTLHIKHYRSLAHVRYNPSFKLLAESEEYSWALAWHG